MLHIDHVSEDGTNVCHAAGIAYALRMRLRWWMSHVNCYIGWQRCGTVHQVCKCNRNPKSHEYIIAPLPADEIYHSMLWNWNGNAIVIRAATLHTGDSLDEWFGAAALLDILFDKICPIAKFRCFKPIIQSLNMLLGCNCKLAVFGYDVLNVLDTIMCTSVARNARDILCFLSNLVFVMWMHVHCTHVSNTRNITRILHYIHLQAPVTYTLICFVKRRLALAITHHE